MDKDELKRIWKENDVVIVIGAVGLSMIIVSGMAAGVMASRVIKRNPIKVQLALTPEFLADVRGIPNPTLSYQIKPR